MTIYTFTNVAKTLLAAPITPTSTTIQVSPGTGSLFPTLSAGQVFMATLLDAATQTTREIVQVTARSGDVLTVVRGQEGTAAGAYAANDLIQLFMTAGAYQNFIQVSQTAGGSLSGSYPNPGLTSVFTSGAGTFTIPTITIGLDGRITSASSAVNVPITGTFSTTSTSSQAFSAPNGGVYAGTLYTTTGGSIQVGTGASNIGGSLVMGGPLTVDSSIGATANIYAGTYFSTGVSGYFSVGSGASSIQGSLYVAGAVSVAGVFTAYIANRFAGIAAFGTPGATVFTVPAGVHYAHFQWVGGGGGGSNCNCNGGNPSIPGNSDVSGGGGGAGAYCEAWIPVTPGGEGTVIIGAGGASQQTGGGTTVAYGAFEVTALGGAGASFVSTGFSPGGAGGVAQVNAGSAGLFIEQPGGYGSDGQSDNFVFPGNGAPGPWGGGGRAGNHSGVGGQAYGAGGGGAYDTYFSGGPYPGGYGQTGVVYVTWYT
jgi:hypothetical protein